MLTVEVNGLVGTLVLNIPPPPSDRLWYVPVCRMLICHESVPTGQHLLVQIYCADPNHSCVSKLSALFFMIPLQNTEILVIS
jgi:hypothetical protein